MSFARSRSIGGLSILLGMALGALALADGDKPVGKVTLRTPKPVYDGREDVEFEMFNGLKATIYYEELLGGSRLGDPCDWSYKVGLVREEGGKQVSLDGSMLALSRGGSSCPFFEMTDPKRLKPLRPGQRRKLSWTANSRLLVDPKWHAPEDDPWLRHSSPGLIPARGSFRIELRYFFAPTKGEPSRVLSEKFELR
jgi:hypothetical protein